MAFGVTTDGFRIVAGFAGAVDGGSHRGAAGGSFELRHAVLPEDTDLLDLARKPVGDIIEKDPVLQKRENQGGSGSGRSRDTPGRSNCSGWGEGEGLANS
ncbi:MAG: hypothetical protein ABI679_12510 [Gemmatimonadota bacterium]